MVERGADLITLAEITGHKTLAMLKRYSHPSDARKLALVRGGEVPPISPTKTTTARKEESPARGTEGREVRNGGEEVRNIGGENEGNRGQLSSVPVGA